jgi:hypothetical protein
MYTRSSLKNLKKLRVRRRRRWQDNIKTDLKETRYGVDWDHLAQKQGSVACYCEHRI